MSDGRDIKTLWRNQTTEDATMPLEEIRTRAAKFHSQIRWRNLREYVASAFVVAIFGFYIWLFPAPLMRIGSALIIAGALYTAWQLRKRSAAAPPPAEASAITWTDYHRHELERQRDALSSIWKWYLGPFVPGVVVFLAGEAMPLRHAARGIVIVVIAVAICIAVFGGVWALNAWGARRLQRKIDELS
jgi:Flp pilus assembly protein TadB